MADEHEEEGDILDILLIREEVAGRRKPYEPSTTLEVEPPFYKRTRFPTKALEFLRRQ
jgi:hypothetical protein